MVLVLRPNALVLVTSLGLTGLRDTRQPSSRHTQKYWNLKVSQSHFGINLPSVVLQNGIEQTFRLGAELLKAPVSVWADRACSMYACCLVTVLCCVKLCWFIVRLLPSCMVNKVEYNILPCSRCPYLEQSASTRHVRTLHVCFPGTPEGFPLQAFLPITRYRNFCSACAMTVTLKPFCLLTYLLTLSWSNVWDYTMKLKRRTLLRLSATCVVDRVVKEKRNRSCWTRQWNAVNPSWSSNYYQCRPRCGKKWRR